MVVVVAVLVLVLVKGKEEKMVVAKINEEMRVAAAGGPAFASLF